jgi:hypothetical protein
VTATQDKTIAARVPLDLRADAMTLAERDHGGDLSQVLRRALRAHVDRELGRTPAGNAGLFAPAEGASHTGDPATSRKAARDTAPRTGSDRFRALERILVAGPRGCTADELLEADEADGRKPAGNGPARRVSELKAAGAIEPAYPTFDSRSPLTRKTRNGSDATVYVATVKGAAWHRAEVRRQQPGGGA